VTAATPSKTVMMVSGGVACVPHVDPAQRGNQIACQADTVRRYRAGAASGAGCTRARPGGHFFGVVGVAPTRSARPGHPTGY